MNETPGPSEPSLPPPPPPPGLYTDSNGVQRYWDGQAWAEQAPVENDGTYVVSAKDRKAPRRSDGPWYKQAWFIIAAAAAVLLLIGGIVEAAGGGSDDKEPVSVSATTSQDADSEEEAEKAEEKAQAEEKRAAEEKAAKAAKAKRKKKIANAKFVSKRNLARVFKNPDNHKGEIFKVWGEVMQFDAATGPDAFLANTAHEDTRSYGFFDGDSAVFMGEVNALEKLVEEDIFTATVEVAGSLSYDTQIGGNTTVPQFDVIKIGRVK